VQAEIPDNTVLIEMATYTALNLQTLGRGIERYVAYLIDNKKVLGYVDLGAAKRIDQAVATLRRVIASPKTDINHAVKLQARKLDQLVMAPIRPLIGNYKNLLISPDGALNLIPFEVLVDENKRYLIETYESNYLTSGRDLLRLQTKTASQTPPLVIADPDYGRGKGPLLAGKQYSELQPLPQALEEAVKIQTLFPQTQIYRGTQATKEVMLVAQSPEILHISTHGYFLTDAALEPDEVSESLLNNDLADWEPGLLENDGLRENEKRLRHSTDLDHDALRAANPLLRSWLFFAGANSNEKSEQGVLTALEVAGLNLFGTKLVVLSACDTGLGTVKNGDGVYGLRRALVLAGAETQLVSLWAVNANATRDLLNEYYQQLKNDIPRRTALRQIALKFLNNKQYAKYRHPYFWASFIQSGEWGKLNN
jgi:CHAT domain-containing protein